MHSLLTVAYLHVILLMKNLKETPQNAADDKLIDDYPVDNLKSK